MILPLLLSLQAETSNLKLVPSGLLELPYRSQLLKTSSTKPNGITKLPEGLIKPSFAKFVLGPKGKSGEFNVLIDEIPDGKNKLYVDGNGNGDFTDDKTPAMHYQFMHRPEGDFITTDANFEVLANYEGKKTPVSVNVGLWRSKLADANNEITLAVDFGFRGDISIGGKTYKGTLRDTTMHGDFAAPTDGKSWVILTIDLNDNGKIDTRGETFKLGEPFNIGGTTYELHVPDGAMGKIELRRSSQNVAEIPPPDVLKAGNTVRPLELKTADGKTITFPTDYKGKIVLLDFFGTWSSAAEEAAPVLKALRDNLKDKGFDIVSVALEVPPGEGSPTRKEGRGYLDTFLKEQNVDWTVTYDEQSWKGAAPQQFAITWAPTRALVDGSTGKILVGPDELQNPTLVRTVYKAFNVEPPQDLLSKLDIKIPDDVKDKELYVEVMRRVERDQAIRQLSDSGLAGEAYYKLWNKIDEDNTAWLKSIFKKYGWPGKSLIGKSGSTNIWLMLQHADRDRPFQKESLALMKKAVDAKEASPANYAYLVDRVLVGEGKKQIYGTQLTSASGKLVPLPIEDEANVDKRRAEMGLKPLKEYLESIGK